MTEVGSRSLIAIVDDDELCRRSIERLLKSSGFRVETFESAEAFLQDGDVDGTACAVLDMRLPGMSGRDLQRRLSAREQPAVVFVSAHNEPEMQASVLRAGAIAFLKKPFEDTALIEAIEMAIRSSSRGQAGNRERC
jgi:FixJ family two-component response regulator